MIIEDEELRDVFKIASEEHLQKLDDGLLYLEQHPGDSAKLEELLRETHSLKGDAGMLAVKNVASLAHQIEHILGGVKRGETQLTSEISDRLSQGLDAIRKLVDEAVTGQDSGVNTFYVLASMMGASNKPLSTAPIAQPESSKVPEEELIQTQLIDSSTAEPETNSETYSATNLDKNYSFSTLQSEQELLLQSHNLRGASAPATASASQPAVSSSSSSSYRIETIRVATKNLDDLMTQAGELTVTKTRLVHRLADIEKLTNLWESWSREAFINRLAFHQIESDKNAFQQNALIIQLQNYYQRTEERLERLGTLVNRLKNRVDEDTARLELISEELASGIRTLRLLPLSTIFNLFPRAVRDLAKREGKEVKLVIEGGETRADKRILEEMKDPLMHLIRNAIDHGIETPADREKLGKHPAATLRIKGYHTASNIIIEVADDGRGLNLDRIKQTAVKRNICTPEELAVMTESQIQSLIFAAGFSTRTFVTEISGRGVGLDVVRTNVEALKGRIQVESDLGKGCTFRLQLSTSLATANVLILAVDGIAYALPVEFIETAILVRSSDVFSLESKATVILDSQPLSVAYLADLLELNDTDWLHNNREWRQESWREFKRNTEVESVNHNSRKMPCIVLKVGEERLGLFIDALIDEQDVVIKPQSQLLKRVRNVSGATILGTGEVCMVLNPHDLIKSVRKQVLLGGVGGARSPIETVSRKQVILLAEDSIATRTQEKRILEGAGYEVVTAVDGLDAFNKLKTRYFDALISDVQMPNLDGLGLTIKIRQLKEYSELPIILVTSLASDEDRKRGADAGANAYIPKGTFNQDVLIETLKRLV
ncbi:MAG: hybrid sensor histidine kinase/response regulator [Microcoleus sp. PH2017_29_MFU_D_A]|uniref:hybrid sensor histidine kinase/response regulator n=1 Tax=unclassified Microcoleus TaxID=2642155 RepID=UPI001D835C52|nr:MULTISPECIES: hybrid sensor histidine kinase/response regulator [unclassified Microcoleus]MCC3605434.1 hybrid sensor histidine kinase/response regulator [Microcoleus sp. PH2017_29_MFU_D_A]MCC3636393.1 hybrid sensor histidine kinase/response regulator [Microcoleus sp. PH2017_37_MFU_D_B]TAE15319.1 MAG: hybrid sensor histidine kinase/response regulator [Oscillatoriales cyanobacterium]TAE26571.1 MAG: hybrid sensor histidine kinase/response regulator [Oscillatoriales cyanobacterium]